MTLLDLIGMTAFLFMADMQEPPATSTPWPTQQWAHAFFSDVGIDEEGMTAFSRALNSGEYGRINQVLLIKNGRLVLNQAFEHDYQAVLARSESANPYADAQRYPYFIDYAGVHTDDEDPADPYYDASRFNYYLDHNVHTLQEITQGVTSALVGMAIARGELEGLQQTLPELLPEHAGMMTGTGKEKITLEDLLTMRSGIAPEGRKGRADSLHILLQRSMTASPDVQFDYNRDASRLLSAIMQRATGMPIDQYAAMHLFRPLGITHTYWQRTPDGLPDTAEGLYLTPHDLAKIGLLYLRGGRWEDRQLIPRSWISASISPWTPDVGRSGDRRARAYGYQWWLLPYGPNEAVSYAVAGLGYGGQRLFLLPEYDLIAVFMSWNIDGTNELPVSVLYDLVLPLVTGSG